VVLLSFFLGEYQGKYFETDHFKFLPLRLSWYLSLILRYINSAVEAVFL
jgi:diacylglycerol kinase